MRFLGKYWYVFAFSCFAALVGFFVWNSPEPELAEPLAFEAPVISQPGGRSPAQLAKPAAPQPEAVARGKQSLAGREPEFVKKMSDAEQQEFYAQLDEIDQIQKEENELQETEVLDDSAFGIVEQ